MGNWIEVALETNGRGFLGHIVNLPGAFVRGRTKYEALKKVPVEAERYLKWADKFPDSQRIFAFFGTSNAFKDQGLDIVQVHRTQLAVEEADSDILLDADREVLNREQFFLFRDLVIQSGDDVYTLSRESPEPNWSDTAREGKTFYGKIPSSIKETLDHIDGVQTFYLSRIGIEAEPRGTFLERRDHCMEKLAERFEKKSDGMVYRVDGEDWTLKKVLRRFLWHDRIHARAMARLLIAQQEKGLIMSFDDPFYFV